MRQRLIEVDDAEFLAVMETAMPANVHAVYDHDDLHLLIAGAFSLQQDEKLALLRDVSRMSQAQIDAVCRILRTEQDNMAALERKYREKFYRRHRRNVRVAHGSGPGLPDAS